MAIGDVYEAQISYQLGSQPILNVIHLEETTAETVADPAFGVNTAIYTMLSDTLLDLLSDDARIIGVYTRRIAPTPGAPSQLVFGTAEFPVLDGTVVSQRIPSQAAALWSFYTILNTRRGRGRIYIPGIPETHQNDGQMTLAAYGLHVIAAGLWVTGPWVPAAPYVGEWTLAVWSRLALDSNQVLSANVRPNLATQRSRRNFPGFGA